MTFALVLIFLSLKSHSGVVIISTQSSSPHLLVITSKVYGIITKTTLRKHGGTNHNANWDLEDPEGLSRIEVPRASPV